MEIPVARVIKTKFRNSLGKIYYKTHWIWNSEAYKVIRGDKE